VGGVGCGGGGGGGGGVGGGGWGIFGKFPGKFWNFTGIFRLVPRTKIEVLKRQIKIFTVGLKENNPEIMLNPPAQYLRKCNFHVFYPSIRIFPNTFKSDTNGDREP